LHHTNCAIRIASYILHHTYCIIRVGQNHIYTVYIWYFWQGNHQIYGHIRCKHTVLANPMHYTQGCEMTVWRYGPSIYGLMNDAQGLTVDGVIAQSYTYIYKASESYPSHQGATELRMQTNEEGLPCFSRVGQNPIYAPCMTVYLVISQPKICVHTVYMYMVLANPVL